MTLDHVKIEAAKLALPLLVERLGDVVEISLVNRAGDI
jgi:hypothetical protein